MFKSYWNLFLEKFVSSEICSTFALAFGKQPRLRYWLSEMILDNIPYRQAVQRGLRHFFMLEVITSKVRNEIRTVKNNLIYIIYFRPVQTIWTVIPFWGITDIIYNEEFDPGSGWTLATGLTHASRGVLKELASDRRPAHGWVTRIQPALHIGIASRKGD